MRGCEERRERAAYNYDTRAPRRATRKRAGRAALQPKAAAAGARPARRAAAVRGAGARAAAEMCVPLDRISVARARRGPAKLPPRPAQLAAGVTRHAPAKAWRGRKQEESCPRHRPHARTAASSRRMHGASLHTGVLTRPDAAKG
jgi:hypothetical protein